MKKMELWLLEKFFQHIILMITSFAFSRKAAKKKDFHHQNDISRIVSKSDSSIFMKYD